MSEIAIIKVNGEVIGRMKSVLIPSIELNPLRPLRIESLDRTLSVKTHLIHMKLWNHPRYKAKRLVKRLKRKYE